MLLYLTNNSKILKDFDNVTKFRLINLFYFTIGLCLLAPVITDLKGELLLTWVISAFMLAEQVSVKFNRYIVETYSLSTIYRMGAIVHIFYTLGTLLYWYNPTVMILWDMTLALVIMAVFNSYSIKLNTYITDNFPSTMTEFQIVRNSINADAFIIGLILSTLVSYFYGIGISIICFFIYNSIFTTRLLSNWNFFKGIE